MSSNSLKRKSLRNLIFGLMCLVGLVLVFGWMSLSGRLGPVKVEKKRPSVIDTETIEDTFPLTRLIKSDLPNPGYVGPDVCSSCHREYHRTFMETKHPRTCRQVIEADMPPGFAGAKAAFQTPYAHIRFEMSRENGQYFQTAIEQSATGPISVRSRLDLVLGSGGVADDVFLTWHDDGFMGELPMAWLYPNQDWAVSHFNPYTHGEFTRNLTVRCIECHSTWVDHVEGSANYYKREGRILGVTCESCHGPGKSHVEFHQQHAGEKIGKSIVKPTRLERERQIEVCTQCHSNAMKHRGPAFQFRPGDRLDRHYLSYVTTATDDDRVANQVKYLRQSRCFMEDEKMTCTTCHDPHQKPNATNSGSATCAKCHSSSDCGDAKNLPEAVRGDCVACHMPTYLKINVNFQTREENFVPPLRRTEHRVGIYAHAKDELLRNYYLKENDDSAKAEVERLTERLTKYFLGEADECSKSHRLLGVVAAMREVVRVNDKPEYRRRLREAIALQSQIDVLSNDAQELISQNRSVEAMARLRQILEIKPTDAKATGLLGTELAKSGDREGAATHLRAVKSLDPNDAYGLSMLGWLAYLAKRDDEALAYYLEAEAIEPREAKLKYQMGLVYGRKRKLPEAIARFKEALTIDPSHAESLQAIIRANIENGTASDGLPYAERVVNETGFQNIQTLVLLGECYQAAGLQSEAVRALKVALRLAPSQQPSMTAALRESIKILESNSPSPPPSR